MSPSRILRPASIAIAATLLAAAASAPAEPTLRADGTPNITADGVGKIDIGDKANELRKKGLIGKTGPGCELAPKTHAAKLKPPLEGSVNLTPGDSRPLKVEQILILGGAEARGVGILDRKRKLVQAYDEVVFDRSTKEVFGIILATVPKRAGGKIQFAIKPDDKRIVSIGVPIIAFCE